MICAGSRTNSRGSCEDSASAKMCSHAEFGRQLVNEWTFVTTGAQTQSHYRGDSGGPLIYKGKLIGIVSGGVEECGEKNVPEGLYTRVSAYKYWIYEKPPPVHPTKIRTSDLPVLGIIALHGALANYATEAVNKPHPDKKKSEMNECLLRSTDCVWQVLSLVLSTDVQVNFIPSSIFLKKATPYPSCHSHSLGTRGRFEDYIERGFCNGVTYSNTGFVKFSNIVTDAKQSRELAAQAKSKKPPKIIEGEPATVEEFPFIGTARLERARLKDRTGSIFQERTLEPEQSSLQELGNIFLRFGASSSTTNESYLLILRSLARSPVWPPSRLRARSHACQSGRNLTSIFSKVPHLRHPRYENRHIPEDVVLRVGSTNWSNGGVEHTVREIIDHEDYHFPAHDIALMEVDKTFQFNSKVQPIEIYPDVDVPDGSKVTVTGWGRTDTSIVFRALPEK
uniref:Peptidase S1 domain-containing protein n=1 Tax=Timema bartmani TaxID=61472 RepID=A0A7R9ENN4_9NEOP|nr:unnamed protein product [Timema bartmani]